MVKFFSMFTGIIVATFLILSGVNNALAQAVSDAVSDPSKGFLYWVQLVINNIPAILAALGATVAAASAWVLITPSPRDDEIVGKIRMWIERFSAFLPSEGTKTRELADDE